MTRTWFLSVFLLGGLACVAQDGAQPGYSVRGTIVNAQTNQPIVRAEVILDQQFAVLTAAEGRFEFDDIPAGDYEVSLRRPGYLSSGTANNAIFGRGFFSPPQPGHHIRVGPGMPDLTFRLVPSGSIRGQVTLSTDDPADGIRISVYRRLVQHGIARWEMAGNTATRSDGVFDCEGLAPGRYMVFSEPSLDRPRMAVRVGALSQGFVGVYYPGVTDAASAGVLTVAAGQTAEADFALTRQTFYPLTAQVRALEPGGHAGFQILDASGRPANFPARYDPRDQVVRASVPNGSWILQAQSFREDRLYGRAPFQVANGPSNIAITLLPVPKIPVTVRREFTASSEASPSFGRRSQRGPEVNLQLENTDPFEMGGAMSIKFDPNPDSSSDMSHGTIEALPGRYWVEADTWTSYVSSITSGGTDLARNPLTISSNSSSTPIEIVLRNDFGTITGQITGQAGNEFGIAPASQTGDVPVIQIYAIPLSAGQSRDRTTIWDGNGQFKLVNLAPGSYRVVACDSPQEIDSRTPEGLAAWAGKGQEVTVAPGGTATVQLTVLHEEQQQP